MFFRAECETFLIIFKESLLLHVEDRKNVTFCCTERCKTRTVLGTVCLSLSDFLSGLLVVVSWNSSIGTIVPKKEKGAIVCEY
jgi:hypothetical protein